jgi:predicted lipoprotein with Yx(FWY)xxD motif
MKGPLIAPASALAVLAAAVLAAGCGGSTNASGSASAGTSSGSSAGSSGGYGYGHGSSSSTPSTSTQAASGAATIAVRTTPLGRILVDGRGMTLYLFEKDTGMKSTCDGSCAKFWPPVTTTGAAKAGSGLDAGKLGTTARADGETEVTYNGHPLYYYAGDKQPGDTTGEGLNAFGALWYVLSPAGKEVVG